VNWSNLLNRVALQRGDPPTHLTSIRLDDPPLSVGDSSLVRWEHFGSAMSRGNAKGWAVDANGRLYCTGAQTIEPLRRLVSGVVENEWSCDIRQVVGVMQSKSPLERFGSLDELAIRASPELSADVSLENLRANLAHHGIRIGQPYSTDCFRRRLWDRGRVFLCNGEPLIINRHFCDLVAALIPEGTEANSENMAKAMLGVLPTRPGERLGARSHDEREVAMEGRNRDGVRLEMPLQGRR